MNCWPARGPELIIPWYVPVIVALKELFATGVRVTEYEKEPALTAALRLRLSGGGGGMVTNAPDTLPVPSPLNV